MLRWPRHMFARILDRPFQVPWHTSALNLLTCSLMPWPTSMAVLASVLLLVIALFAQRWKMADLMALLFSTALMLQILIVPSPLRKCQTLDHGDRPTSFRNEQIIATCGEAEDVERVMADVVEQAGDADSIVDMLLQLVMRKSALLWNPQNYHHLRRTYLHRHQHQLLHRWFLHERKHKWKQFQTWGVQEVTGPIPDLHQKSKERL